MSVRKIEIVTDDVLDTPLNGNAKREVKFAWDGVETTLDVAPEVYDAFKALTKKNAAHEPTPDGSLLRVALNPPRPTVNSTRNAAIRAWAREQKNTDGTAMYDVKDRGALPSNIEEAYDAAQAEAAKK
jgi:hypothetical protein